MTTNAFRNGSKIAEVFALCVAGTTRVKLTNFCEKNEVGFNHMLGGMKLQSYGGVTWKFTEDEDGNMKITSVAGTPKVKAPKSEAKSKATAKKPAPKTKSKSTPKKKAASKPKATKSVVEAPVEATPVAA